MCINYDKGPDYYYGWADCCEFIYWDEPQYWWDINEYGNNYYYPVLPKLNRFDKFDESLGLQQSPDGEDNIPFGSKDPIYGDVRIWNEDDIFAYVTLDDVEDDDLILDLEMSEVEDNSISDRSEQGNVGLLIRDYGIKYEDKKVSANKALVSPQKAGMNEKHKAY
jgi:hypothetical protein